MSGLPSEYLPSPEESEQSVEGKAETAVPLEAKFLFDLQSRTEGDPNELLKNAYLCRGAGLLLVAPTGVGKSVLLTQLLISWGLGRDCFGIRPVRPLKTLLIQAENDEGDLSEMRDGICHGLRLTAEEIASVRERILIFTEDARTGAELIALVDHLLKTYKPDLLALDPALSYLGGESNSQKDVGGFLRNMLNPVIHRHRCAAVIVHHGNKPPSGREKPDFHAGDFAYLGAGSAEWANWSRAVLAVRNIGSHEIYELRAGKRGSRLGWKDSDGKSSYTRLIGHSNEPGHIYWRDASDNELDRGGRPKEYSADDILELLPAEGLTTTEWQELARSECGVKERRFYQLIKSLKQAGRILKSKVNQKWQPIVKRI